VQGLLGTADAAHRVEHILGVVARRLVRSGVGQLVIAGGETSGACIKGLGLRSLRIGPQIDPGVPWCYAEAARLHVCLKSGNFGGLDFFSQAFQLIES
jgi:uncharacterized protein YgbK (DUF1537 family)